MFARSPISRAPRLSRILALALPVFLLLSTVPMLLLQPHAPALAQNGGAGKDTAKESGEVFDALDDIDRLNVLTPVKLTPDQVDKLIAAISSSQSDYNAKLKALAAPVADMGDEVKAVKRKALAGETISKEFLDKVNKLQTTFNQKKLDLDVKTWEALAGKVKGILTESQIATVAKMTRDERAKAKSDTKGTDVQMMSWYVLEMFIKNPRILPLLKEVRAASGKEARNPSDPNGKG